MASLSKSCRTTRSSKGKQNQTLKKNETNKSDDVTKDNSSSSSLQAKSRNKKDDKVKNTFCMDKCKFHRKFAGKDSVRCAMCCEWFHVVCLNLPADEIAGPMWVCFLCRQMPAQIK